MEKRTLLAVVLSVVVISGFYLVQGLLFPPKSPADLPVGIPTESSQGVTPALGAGPSAGAEAQTGTILAETAQPAAPVAPASAAVQAANEPSAQSVTIDTNLIKVVLTNAGGDISSYQLKEHNDHGDPVDMVLSGNAAAHAFNIAFGSRDDLLAKRVKPIDAFFRVRRVSDYIVEFSRDFALADGGQFTLIKRYEFKPNEYLFQLDIVLNGGQSVRGFDFQGAAYTLSFGPQMGPKFEKLDQRYEYRHYITYKGKLKNEKVNDNGPTVISTQPSWASIAGKYFTFIAYPYVNQFDIAFSTQAEPGLPAASRFLITRPSSSSSVVEDRYQFYLGPKNQEILGKYNTADNDWKLKDTGFIEVANTRGFLAPLETLLKWILMFFHRIVRNYGVAIILVTLLVKLIMFPLTKKGSESTMRMQTLSPKIKEIQEKYKDNPQKMNAEMAAFYKKEGYNPLSGCLPMIIQIPIFFAMYNLFNNHFDLRGAMFIPGWIPDLSLPESVYNFAPFKLPFLGWSDIRLLPFIYVGSQLLYGKVTQTPDQQGNAQMKLMLYAMPIVFFFILYDVPSGLLIYWIMSNVLTMVQQVSINKFIAKKKAIAAANAPPEPKPVIAPPKRKKRK
ncbi:membrane protein insertase YidC [Leadbettera azotonutricia]|uniref:Membrane protein insertase YidC n=1 Tax=Leadbettera azotonutricia (strain ATCC BAA-888 / DSM 13862 / ZAS-9) TaxID=545695 RepID=F5Y9C1_LEAAZ|nr:membrane protein insertase YidC [Leadbettera azotonutricia]AEF81171.1 inner membrane protein OxaA [Leadbettera azotonutricia ZAS-9]